MNKAVTHVGNLVRGIKRRSVVLLLVVIGLMACNRGKISEPSREFTADEYNAVSAYVAGLFDRYKGQPQVSTIVFLNMTSFGEDQDFFPDKDGRGTWEKTAEFLRKQAPALQPATIDGFRKANSQQAFLRTSFHFPVGYQIIDSAQIKPLFVRNGGNWPAYYKQYPGAQGIGTLSRVGFSADGSQALFYIKNVCGGLCGGGFYVVVEKRDGRWVLSKEIQVWVS